MENQQAIQQAAEAINAIVQLGAGAVILGLVLVMISVVCKAESSY